MSEKQGKNSKSLFQKLTDMLNPQPGLTKEEKKRYAEAKHTLEGSGKVKEVPDTAQKTITFRKMYRDGICQVTPTYYTKMVEFYDINYDLLEIDDQGDILEEMGKTGMPCALTICVPFVKIPAVPARGTAAV